MENKNPNTHWFSLFPQITLVYYNALVNMPFIFTLLKNYTVTGVQLKLELKGMMGMGMGMGMSKMSDTMEVSRHGHMCNSSIYNNMHPSWKDKNTILNLTDMDW